MVWAMKRKWLAKRLIWTGRQGLRRRTFLGQRRQDGQKLLAEPLPVSRGIRHHELVAADVERGLIDHAGSTKTCSMLCRALVSCCDRRARHLAEASVMPMQAYDKMSDSSRQ